MRALTVALALVAASAGAQDGGFPFAGAWKIDLSQCSDLTPVFERYEPNVFVRKLAGVVAPVDVITFKGDRFELEVHAVLLNLKTVVHLDGKTPTKDEFFGNPYAYTSTLDGGVVFSQGDITRPDGSKDPFTLERSLAADGAMITTMVISPKGSRQLTVKRVLRRQPP